jgi:hypothetical protein
MLFTNAMLSSDYRPMSHPLMILVVNRLIEICFHVQDGNTLCGNYQDDLSQLCTLFLKLWEALPLYVSKTKRRQLFGREIPLAFTLGVERSITDFIEVLDSPATTENTNFWHTGMYVRLF